MPTSFKLIGIGFLLTLVGFVFVQQELRLKIWGKTVIADVMDDYEQTSRRSKNPTSLGLTYRFIDDKGEPVTGSATVPLDYKGEPTTSADGEGLPGMPRVLKVKVVYLPGKTDIRKLATDSAFKSYLMFFGGIGLLMAGVYVFKNESVVEAHRQTNEDLENAGKSRAHRVINRLAGD